MVPGRIENPAASFGIQKIPEQINESGDRREERRWDAKRECDCSGMWLVEQEGGTRRKNVACAKSALRDNVERRRSLRQLGHNRHARSPFSRTPSIRFEGSKGETSSLSCGGKKVEDRKATREIEPTQDEQWRAQKSRQLVGESRLGHGKALSIIALHFLPSFYCKERRGKFPLKSEVMGLELLGDWSPMKATHMLNVQQRSHGETDTLNGTRARSTKKVRTFREGQRADGDIQRHREVEWLWAARQGDGFDGRDGPDGSRPSEVWKRRADGRRRVTRHRLDGSPKIGQFSFKYLNPSTAVNGSDGRDPAVRAFKTISDGRFRDGRPRLTDGPEPYA
ncbi:hypothetical protein B0H16DRAFT_1466256 [Mycena metata]|uniref:Uncharacterized protein n=1 Tax=Mycena metata TaxID=1033252 RepID=A0AAD7IA76_9AGAR|nr:hypothetical protein B0H16DRAFT_1466256 [Mycena metata]